MRCEGFVRLLWLGLLCAGVMPVGASAVELRGEPMQWHGVELLFRGDTYAEDGTAPNPFLDFRLQCRLTGPSGQVYDVPGFFDTDGEGGVAGDAWICRFSPDEPGRWRFEASFREGAAVAVSTDPGAGTPLLFDGETGGFDVAPSDKEGRDFRSPEKGRLENAGAHYLTFAGSGEPWVKGGPDIPENFLGYEGFDNTPNGNHSYAAHRRDWRSGDPDWGNGAGRGIIGALNYIAQKGSNTIYFLPMNIGGDGKDTFPTIGEQDRTHYDTSKLAQWEAVFAHAQSLGIFLHFQLAETEGRNENYHDDGQLGVERKLYYRELVARFGHHLGLEWDLGEENDYGTSRRREFAAYIKSVDPYDHPLTTHIRTNQMESFYGPLLGNDDFDMTAFQVNFQGLDRGASVIEWRKRSAAAGVPWVVSVDEPQTIENDPFDQARGLPRGRREYMWPTYLSGGGGFEWYVQDDGGGHSLDQRIDDLRELDLALEWTGIALEFLAELPLLEMSPDPSLGSSSEGGRTHVLAAEGRAYALYHEDGGVLSLDLRKATGSFAVQWFDPVEGGFTDGPVVEGGAWRELGRAPFDGDVAALVTTTDAQANRAPVA
ncbi:MAG: DUF5060 domain-containing protein, partial [Myxococcota bacterium]|nr:DUF5060 domain-containing protein [Myxococcota bacterium]